jgi:uncharacterized membrane protein
MGQSTCLALAMASFVGTHLLLSHPLRAPTVRVLGEKGFLGLYSLISFATLGWAIYIAWHSPAQTPLWIAPIWGWHVATIVMLIATILLVGSLIGNPAMVDPTGQPKFPAQARGVYAITRHPMMWSFILWAIVHAALWGSPKTLIFAAGIGGLALIGALGQDVKKAKNHRRRLAGLAGADELHPLRRAARRQGAMAHGDARRHSPDRRPRHLAGGQLAASPAHRPLAVDWLTQSGKKPTALLQN